MKVRSNRTESENQSRLFSGDKTNTFNAFVHFSREETSHRAFALSAIIIAPVFDQDLTGAARAGVDRVASSFFINAVADANYHKNIIAAYENDCQAHCE
jgi:hypothetical protein